MFDHVLNHQPNKPRQPAAGRFAYVWLILVLLAQSLLWMPALAQSPLFTGSRMDLSVSLPNGYLHADQGLIAEATQAINLNPDGSASSNSAAQITTQYAPKANSEWGTGALFIKTKNSNGQDTFAYYHQDQQQTPVQATDKAGNIVWAASYSAFGKASITTPQATADKPTLISNLRLPGQYEDAETGLHYNYRRYYDPEIGRYISQDPIGLEGGINRYTYVAGNPVSFGDPMGLVTCVMVTRSAGGIGTHAALYMSRVKRNGSDKQTTSFIYDPAGSYSGNDNFSFGSKADMERFADYHKKKDGDATEAICKNTSAEEEQRLYERSLAEGPQGGLACSISVSNVFGGSPYFPKIRPGTILPGNLYTDAK